MNNQIVVVTGAAGCLGYQLVKLLVSKDDQVMEIRCLDLETPQELQLLGIEKAQQALELASDKSKRKTIKWVQGDIRDVILVEGLLKDADCVIHCAAKIQVNLYYADQNEDELKSVNINGTENLLRTCIKLGVSKFVYASSYEAWQGYEMIYYATENTMPTPNCLLFGASAETKREAANKVVEYANSKLRKRARDGSDCLNAVILDLPPIYGEFDKHYLTLIMKVTKFFGGKLQRVSNIWSRQQPIYAGNAAWAAIVAKNKMASDTLISGEHFIITDNTKILDPFNFIKPYLECRGMSVTRNKYPYLPIWALMVVFFKVLEIIRSMDVLSLLSRRSKRRINLLSGSNKKYSNSVDNNSSTIAATDNVHAKVDAEEEETNILGKRWYDVVNPQLLAMMCMTCFFNRTKSSLRLDYEPLFTANESEAMSLEWYEKHCII